MTGFGPSKSQYKPLDEGSDVGQFLRSGVQQIVDPDQFFRDIYDYHQSGGFYVSFMCHFPQGSSSSIKTVLVFGFPCDYRC